MKFNNGRCVTCGKKATHSVRFNPHRRIDSFRSIAEVYKNKNGGYCERHAQGHADRVNAENYRRADEALDDLMLDFQRMTQEF
mgnify:CR=1 FL=1|jgi:hypothetical protein